MATKLFLKSSDIAAVTGMSLRSAQYVIAMFADRGQIVRCGDSTRGQMVDVNLFVQWLCSQDGVDPAVRKRDILNSLKEKG